MRFLLPLVAAILAASLSMPASAADLLSSWTAVTTDDTGADLVTPVSEYRIYRCGEPAPIASVGGSVTEFLEEDVITGTGSFCREVTAYAAPFESTRTQATLVVVVPGAPASVNVQALP